MQFSSIDAAVVIEIFLLLLIGLGPKIALVPFVQLTSELDDATKRSVARKMITTATTIAVLLVVLGGLLTRLLHFSTGALSIAAGIILFVIAATMVLGREEKDEPSASPTVADPLRMAVFPLAVPYLLNPVGVVVLVTASAEAASIGMFALVVALLALVVVFDIAVFRWANHVSARLDQTRMLVTEKVFGFLLAALGVQLALNGLSHLGIIHLTGH